MTGPIEPSDPATGGADGPPGGGSPRGYSWVWGLLGILVVFAVVALLVGAVGGGQNPPSR